MNDFKTLKTINRDWYRRLSAREKTVIFLRKLRNRVKSIINKIVYLKNKDRFTNKPVAGSWSRKINIERNLHAKDILQPFNNDGTKNNNFQKVYGNDHYIYNN